MRKINWKSNINQIEMHEIQQKPNRNQKTNNEITWKSNRNQIEIYESNRNNK